jgi:hypothetical protein
MAKTRPLVMRPFAGSDSTFSPTLNLINHPSQHWPSQKEVIENIQKEEQAIEILLRSLTSRSLTSRFPTTRRMPPLPKSPRRE